MLFVPTNGKQRAPSLSKNTLLLVFLVNLVMDEMRVATIEYRGENRYLSSRKIFSSFSSTKNSQNVNTTIVKHSTLE